MTQDIKILAGFLRMLLLVLPILSSNAHAADLGNSGTTYEIAEPSLLDAIKQKLTALESSGDIAKYQTEMQAKAERGVNNPPAVKGIHKTDKARVFVYDPTITVAEDLKDQDGLIFHKAGEKVNPLDTIKLSKSLIFIDGSDEAQVKWALSMNKKQEGHSKIILTNGAVMDLMKTWQHRFYFDQKGLLTTKLQIKQVPAIVRQEGNKLRIEEVLI